MALQLLRTTQFQRMRASVPTAVESALARNTTTKPDYVTVEGFRGGRLRFFSNGANDETATVTLYEVNLLEPGPLNGAIYQTESLGTLALTFGTSVGPFQPLMNAADRWADTMVWTASTYGTAVLTYTGGNAAAFSPVANLIAEFLISDFGGAHGIAAIVTTYGLTAGKTLQGMMKLDV